MSAPCWNEKGTGGDGTCQRLAEAGICSNCPEYSMAGRKLFDRETDEAERDHWTRLLAEEKEERALGLSSAIVFRLGDEWLGLPARLFDRAVELKPLRTVPGRMGRIFKGLVNVGGELLPCMDARQTLSIAPGEEEDAKRIVESCLAVVRAPSGRFAFEVDEMLGVVRFDPAETKPPPTTVAKAKTPYAASILEREKKSVTMLDETALFETFDRSLAP